MIDQIKRVVSEFLAQFTSTKYGHISAYNPNDYTVKVLIMPTLQETGFVPLSAPWVGNNFGAVFGPAIGDSVRLDFIDGRLEATVVGARFFNNSARPPVVQSGQAAIVDSKGSYVKLNNDGTVTINAATGMTLTGQTITLSATTKITNSAPTVEIDGTMQQGNGPNGGTASMVGPLTVTNDVTANGTSVHSHIHGDPQGGDTTAPL